MINIIKTTVRIAALVAAVTIATSANAGSWHFHIKNETGSDVSFQNANTVGNGNFGCPGHSHNASFTIPGNPDPNTTDCHVTSEDKTTGTFELVDKSNPVIKRCGVQYIERNLVPNPGAGFNCAWVSGFSGNKLILKNID